MQCIRHKFIVEDQSRLTELQYKNWSYFIEKIIAVSKNRHRQKQKLFDK